MSRERISSTGYSLNLNDMYTVRLTPDARKDLVLLQKKAPHALTKLAKLLDELKEHPENHGDSHH